MIILYSQNSPKTTDHHAGYPNAKLAWKLRFPKTPVNVWPCFCGKYSKVRTIVSSQLAPPPMQGSGSQFTNGGGYCRLFLGQKCRGGACPANKHTHTYLPRKGKWLPPTRRVQGGEAKFLSMQNESRPNRRTRGEEVSLRTTRQPKKLRPGTQSSTWKIAPVRWFRFAQTSRAKREWNLHVLP